MNIQEQLIPLLPLKQYQLPKIKELYLSTRIAFGKSGEALGKRSEEELIDLAIIARESGNPNILILFETISDLNTLKKLKMDIKIKATQKIIEDEQEGK